MSGPFGFDLPEDDPEDRQLLERMAKTFEPERARCAFDGGRMVGTLGVFSFEMTVPGGSIPVAGTTQVTVQPTHRRRGCPLQMMRPTWTKRSNAATPPPPCGPATAPSTAGSVTGWQRGTPRSRSTVTMSTFTAWRRPRPVETGRRRLRPAAGDRGVRPPRRDKCPGWSPTATDGGIGSSSDALVPRRRAKPATPWRSRTARHRLGEVPAEGRRRGRRSPRPGRDRRQLYAVTPVRGRDCGATCCPTTSGDDRPSCGRSTTRSTRCSAGMRRCGRR
jgi:hypothetical protein